VHVEVKDLAGGEVDDELGVPVGAEGAGIDVEGALVGDVVAEDPRRAAGAGGHGGEDGEKERGAQDKKDIVEVMKVMLIRHAHGVDGASGGDAARWLTEKGRGVARKVGERLRDDGHEPDAIVTSPLVRAVQTAELVARGLKFRGVVEVMVELAPEAPGRSAGEGLQEGSGFVVAVGREPGIWALAGELAGKTVGAFGKGEALLVKEGKVAYRLGADEL